MSNILYSSLLSIVFTGCGTLQPDSSVTADPSISWSDLRDIERLLPVVGVRHPITSISRVGPNQYSVQCRGHQPSNYEVEQISFVVFRRDGRWFADKSSISRGKAVIVE